jgi:hypothetical protein
MVKMEILQKRIGQKAQKSLVAFLLGRTEQKCDLLVIQVISIL